MLQIARSYYLDLSLLSRKHVSTLNVFQRTSSSFRLLLSAFDRRCMQTRLSCFSTLIYNVFNKTRLFESSSIGRLYFQGNCSHPEIYAQDLSCASCRGEGATVEGSRCGTRMGKKGGGKEAYASGFQSLFAKRRLY